jgi:hypothetical protein
MTITILFSHVCRLLCLLVLAALVLVSALLVLVLVALAVVLSALVLVYPVDFLA